MADNFRYRRGDASIIMVPVQAPTVIEIGDLLFRGPAGNALPAQDQGDLGSTVINQDVFNDNFLGVAHKASDAGDTEEITVGTTGEYEFDCAAGTFKIGDYVGPAMSGGAPANQTVAKVTHPSLAIGRCAKHYATNTTAVLVRIQSTVLFGGVQGPEDSSSSSGL